jgi:hypothetical protein
MQRVPHVVGRNSLTSVTYSQFEELEECPLKGLRKALVLDAALPDFVPSRASLIGHFHHRALELAATAGSVQELERSVEEEILSLQTTVNRWPHLAKLGSVSGWDEVNRSASLARRVAASRANRAGSVDRGIERELRSRDGMLVGRPDYFSVDGAVAYLREYKSGPIRDPSGLPLDRYVRQLRFYSQLLVDNYGAKEVSGSVESLNGDAFQCVIAAEDAAAFAKQVWDTVSAINADVRTAPTLSSLARPAADACDCCSAQVICSNFKGSDALQSCGREQFFVEGTVLELDIQPASFLTRVTLADTYRGTVVHLNIPADAAVGLAKGGRFAFQYLRRHGGQLRWGTVSRVLSCG